MNTRISLLLASAGLIALGACTDPYGQPTEMNRAQQGAIAGAVVGGVIGATRDDNKVEKAALGALAGGLLGGAVGSMLDRQAADLQQNIGNDNISVVNNGDYLTVTMPQDILFATDSTAVSPALTRDIYAVAANLNRYPNTRVEVIGHTDNTGRSGYNQDLSQRRAQAVAALLQGGGVSASRIAAYGRGESQPVASNDTEAGRAQNRRVEIIIRPM